MSKEQTSDMLYNKIQAKANKASEKAEALAEKVAEMLIVADEIIIKDDIWSMNVGRNTVFFMKQGKHRVQVYKETLMSYYGSMFDNVKISQFCDLLKVADRNVVKLANDWTTKTGGIRTGSGTFNLMNRDFCKAEATGSTEVHWFLDLLIGLICENDGTAGKEALEQILYGKWIDPSNMFIPSINLVNADGGVGKSLFVECFVEQLFGGSYDKVKVGQITGKFNGAIAGKAVLFINENSWDPKDQEALKDIMGSNKIAIELKGKETFTAPLTALLIFATNREGGSVMLSGNNVDRRYTLLGSDGSLNDSTLVQLKARGLVGQDATRADATTWIEEVGQFIIRDHQEIGKWINSCAKKFGTVPFKIKAFHGVTYQACLVGQEQTYFSTIREVLEDTRTSIIDVRALIDIVRLSHENETKFMKDTGILFGIKTVLKGFDSFELKESMQVQVMSSDRADRKQKNIIKLKSLIVDKTITLNERCVHLGSYDRASGFKPNKI